MKYTISSINTFLFFKLPSVWWCGIRVREISKESCSANVRLGWFNKNPFKSLFWAVQGMAAELTTGILIMQAINESKKNAVIVVIESTEERLQAINQAASEHLVLLVDHDDFKRIDPNLLSNKEIVDTRGIWTS